MKRFNYLLSALLFFLSVGIINAANSNEYIEQVTSSETVSGDVDYHITGTTPFSSVGTINIETTEHTVVIIDKVKPSVVISRWLKNVFIQGAQAVNDENCQVKMFGRGAIIFPYDKNIRPLTCYTEQKYGGESCDNYTEGHSGGYMKTLSNTTLNNKIRSFKLKRGYMVTFAIGTGGWGYSRCFIADMADLEVPTLSNVLDMRISSYRLFKWYNAHKAGLASDGRAAANSALNSSWCYDWGQGNTSTLPDTEWVPNHIYEDWPSSGTIGQREGTCHTKTNNEPGNSADDRPQDVETVLANWQNMMRTGLRLCSETSHDGSMSHLKSFIDSIDARGWRCDILDLHCYWASGFNNLTWYSDNYGHGRPIWISEWIWGASWNRNGAFGSGVTDNTILEETKNILSVLNSNPRVERYAYWNSESKAHIYESSLTDLGKYYASMDVPLAYNASNEFIPRDPRIEELGTLNGSYLRANGYNNLSWTDPNGDLATTITVQYKFPGSNLWKNVDTVEPKDKSSSNGASYTYHHDTEESGVYYYRIRMKSYNNKTFYTNEISINVDPAQGSNTFQFGKLSLPDTEEQTTYYSEEMSEVPRVFIGTRINKNSTFYGSNIVAAKSTTKYFSYQLTPWAKSKSTTLSVNEEIPFMSLPAGNYNWGGLQCEVGDAKAGKSTAEDLTVTSVTEVTFAEPFAEGVTPIVLLELRNPSFKNSVLGLRVFDVTNTGFKFITYLESGCTTKLLIAKNVCYFAIAPGIGVIDAENNVYIAAGHGTTSQIYGSIGHSNQYICPQTDPQTGEVRDGYVYFKKPYVFTSLQTNNYPYIYQLRRTDLTVNEDGATWYSGVNLVRIAERELEIDGQTIPSTSISEDYSNYRDDMGWVCISNEIKAEIEIATGISSFKTDGELLPRVSDGRIFVDGASDFSVYKVSGMAVPSDAVLEPGVYIIRANGRTMKVLVK